MPALLFKAPPYPQSSGLRASRPGRLQPESLAAFSRNQWPLSTGARTQCLEATPARSGNGRDAYIRRGVSWRWEFRQDPGRDVTHEYPELYAGPGETCAPPFNLGRAVLGLLQRRGIDARDEGRERARRIAIAPPLFGPDFVPD